MLLTGLLTVWLSFAGFQEPVPGDWPGAEGPLANDVFAPTAAEAEALLARGDAAWAARQPLPEVFDRWHDALEAAEPGSSVAPRPRVDGAGPGGPPSNAAGNAGEPASGASPWPDLDGTADRRTEGLERALLRRLRAIGGEARATWTGRFAALAEDALARSANRPSALADLERRHPCTPAAARAALTLADLELEAGRTALAGLWLERAREHAALLEPFAAGAAGAANTEEAGSTNGFGPARLERLRAALDRRTRMLAALEPELDVPSNRRQRGGAWERATALEPVAFVPLARSSPRGASPGGTAGRREPAPGLGVQPGLCVLESGLAVAQTAERLHLFDPRDGAPRGDLIPAMMFEPANWIAGTTAARSTRPPGWPLLPRAHGNAVIAIQGRTIERAGNVLVCVDIDPGAAVLTTDAGQASRSSASRLGSLRWALRGDQRLDGSGLAPSGLGLEPVEFQPGPVVLGSQLFVQVREASAPGREQEYMRNADQVPSWLVAVDLETGAVNWKRFLAQGLVLARSDARFGISLRPPVSAAQPLTTSAGRIFAGTHLGLGALVEPDGRLVWSLWNRRRSPEPEGLAGSGGSAGTGGWSGAAPPAFGGSTGGTAGLLWAPADSDFAYRLGTGPVATPAGTEPRDAAGTRGPLLDAPVAIGEAEVLLGGDLGEALVLARAGRERHAAAWLTDGRRHEAPFLGPGERFTGHGAVSAERALFATQRGVLLLDRARELFLLDYAPLADPYAGRTGAGGGIGLGAGTRGTAGAKAPESGGSVQAFGDRVAVVGPAGVWLFAAK